MKENLHAQTDNEIFHSKRSGNITTRKRFRKSSCGVSVVTLLLTLRTNLSCFSHRCTICHFCKFFKINHDGLSVANERSPYIIRETVFRDTSSIIKPPLE